LNAGRRYLDQRLSLAQIDLRIGFSKGTAARLAHDYAILIRGGIDDNRRAHPALPRDWLFDRHATHERGLADLVRAGAIEADRDPDSLRIVCRGIVHLDVTCGRRSALLSGSYRQIRDDTRRLIDQGVTELFYDLNWDPRLV
jgi:hypothetical protein